MYIPTYEDRSVSDSNYWVSGTIRSSENSFHSLKMKNTIPFEIITFSNGFEIL
jgi:hypothetical protein